jgi:hypothetical protein
MNNDFATQDERYTTWTNIPNIDKGSNYNMSR